MYIFVFYSLCESSNEVGTQSGGFINFITGSKTNNRFTLRKGNVGVVMETSRRSLFDKLAFVVSCTFSNHKLVNFNLRASRLLLIVFQANKLLRR